GGYRRFIHRRRKNGKLQPSGVQNLRAAWRSGRKYQFHRVLERRILQQIACNSLFVAGWRRTREKIRLGATTIQRIPGIRRTPDEARRKSLQPWQSSLQRRESPEVNFLLFWRAVRAHL